MSSEEDNKIENEQDTEKNEQDTKIETKIETNNTNNNTNDSDNSFRRDLWDGTKKIYDRYDAGKKTLTDMISIFKMRAEGEEKFIKDMTLISNKTHALREGGSYGTAWLDIRNSHKELSKDHTTLLDSIRKDIIAPLEQFKKEKQQIKDRLNNEEKNLCSQLKSLKEKVESLKEKYHTLSDQAEVALLNLKKARNDPSFDKKKMVKLEENNNKLSSESIKAHEQYKQTLSELNIFQRKYEEEMHKILESLQVIEEERLDFVKQILDKYLEFNDKYINSERELHTSITKGVLAMDRNQDLKNWIDSNKTGIESKEIPVEYVPYLQKYGGDVSTVPKPKGLLSKLGFGKKKKPSTPTKETEKPKETKVSTPIKVEHKTPKESKETKDVKSDNVSNEPSDVEVVEVKRAKASFDFVKTEDNELSFKIGDILNITRIDDSGWWEGELNGEIGLVPGNYLTLLNDVEDEPKNTDSEESKSKEEGVSPKKETTVKEETTTKEEPKKEEHKKELPTKDEPKKELPKKDEPKKELPTKDEPKKELPTKDEPKKEHKKELPTKDEPKKELPKKDEPKVEEVKKDEVDEDSGDEETNPIGKCVALYDFPGEDEDELKVRAGESVIIYSQVEGWYTGTNEAGDYGMVPANYLSPMEKI